MNKKIMIYFIALIFLNGCSTSKQDMFPHNNKTMLYVWQMESGSNELHQERAQLIRPIEQKNATDDLINYTRTAQNEIYNQFKRLPNPDLVMFVFPHLTKGDNPVPVPGYSTVFPFYHNVQYAMPGENVEEL